LEEIAEYKDADALGLGDLNGDGVPDLVAVGGYRGHVRIWLGTGDGSLAEGQRIDSGEGGALDISDLNGDGWPDLVTVGDHRRYDPGSVSVFLNLGDGTFAPERRFGHEWCASGVADLLLFFRVAETGIACGDESATLSGSFRNGMRFEGSDSIVTRGCPPPRWRHEIHGK
jgi:hypothetical protein